MERYCFRDKKRVCDDSCQAFIKDGMFIGKTAAGGPSQDMLLTSPCTLLGIEAQKSAATENLSFMLEKIFLKED